jgi:adenylate cyclase
MVILAADMAGYSRLMAADERATVAALDAAREVFKSRIAARQGRVIDTAGDSVLAVFDTAAGAASAALEIQKDLGSAANSIPEERRMLFRIGVHLGDVLEKADGTIYGDGVNVAARLQSLAEPAGVFVSDAIRTAVRGKVDAAFDDLGEQKVKNIPEPVRAWRIREAGAPVAKSTAPAAEPELALPDKPSIAVLPFDNMSGDPEQEYFTDGVVEDIITALSRFRSLFVIARNSSFTYKGKAVDVRTVAKELGVRYVVEGSIRRAGNRIRVTAQLIDSVTGNHVWAEKYDRVLEDVFAVQEEVTQSIVGAIAPQIAESELDKTRRRGGRDLSAYEISLRAYAHVTEADLRMDGALRERAILEAREALAIEPRNILALNALGWALQNMFLFRTSSHPDRAWHEAMDVANRMIEIDPSDSRGYLRKGHLLAISKWLDQDRLDEALACFRTAHELNPNDMRVLVALGVVLTSLGKSQDGVGYIFSALRISPRDPLRAYARAMLAYANILSRNYAKAVEHTTLAISESPNLLAALVWGTVANVGVGDIESAKATFEKARQLGPAYIQIRLDGRWMMRRAEDQHRCTVFLRVAAGLDEPGAAEAVR